MTDINKQALEDLEMFDNGSGMDDIYNIQTFWRNHEGTIRAALQPKPSVDVEGMEVLASKFAQEKLKGTYNFTFDVLKCLKDFGNYLHSQGSLNQGWQPIESAPKDGTPVDMWVIRKHEHGGQDERRRPNVTWGKICNTLTGDVYNGWQGLEDLYAEIIPTHWMPSPQPPSEVVEALKSARKELEKFADYTGATDEDGAKLAIKNDAWKECDHIDAALALLTAQEGK